MIAGIQRLTQRSIATAVVLSLSLLCGSALAAGPGNVKVLTFEGLANGEPVNQFYNGGTGGSGSGPGTNFGISFSANSLALIDADSGGSGNFGGEPSPDTVLYFESGGASTMNVATGFTTGFSFYYSSPTYSGTVIVYDGVDGTGNVLATINLPTTPNNGAPDPTGNYSPFIAYGASFSGTARSVSFGGSAGYIAFDDITVGASSPGQSKTCASEGYKGAQLTWCKNICENGLTGQVLDTWIHRWIGRYRDLPYCAVESMEPPHENNPT